MYDCYYDYIQNQYSFLLSRQVTGLKLNKSKRVLFKNKQQRKTLYFEIDSQSKLARDICLLTQPQYTISL